MPAELEALTLQELRQRRDAVHAQEEELSYRRRLLHAQLDLIEAAGSVSDHEEFASMMAEVLSDAPTTSNGIRAVDIDDAPDLEMEPLPGDLVDLDDEEREALLERIRAEEQQVSDRRRTLLDELDALQDELVRRFRRDGVNARELLGEGN